MKKISVMTTMDILERTKCIIDYMASSIATKESNALIEQAGAFIILSDAADRIRDAMDEISVMGRGINIVLSEALEQNLIDERFESILNKYMSA